MASFDQLLKDPVALCAALEAISIEGKLRADLQRLYDSADGVPSGHDEAQRVTGDTVRSCNAIGTRLGKQLRIKLPHDAMMWLGSVKRDAVGTERWVMRAEIRAVLKRLGWFGPGPVVEAPSPTRRRRGATAP